jgi:hypothetical protein
MFTETKGVVRFVILSTITVQCLSRVASIVTAGYIVNQYYFVFAKGVVRLIVAVDYLTTHTSLSPIRRGFEPGFVIYKKGALDSQPQVIKFIPVACPWSVVLSRLPPPLKLVAMI